MTTEPKITLLRKLLPRRGVVINYISYWSEMLEDPSLYGRQLPVRFDPHDASTVWVQTHGVWTECHSRDFARMKGVSISAVKLAARESRKTRKGVRSFGQERLTDFLNQQRPQTTKLGFPATSEEDE